MLAAVDCCSSNVQHARAWISILIMRPLSVAHNYSFSQAAEPWSCQLAPQTPFLNLAVPLPTFCNSINANISTFAGALGPASGCRQIPSSRGRALSCCTCSRACVRGVPALWSLPLAKHKRLAGTCGAKLLHRCGSAGTERAWCYSIRGRLICVSRPAKWHNEVYEATCD